MSTRIADLLRLDEHAPPWRAPAPPILIALHGIIAVYRDIDASDNEPSEVILEGGVKILVSRTDGEFVSREWEAWAARAPRGEG